MSLRPSSKSHPKSTRLSIEKKEEVQQKISTVIQDNGWANLLRGEEK